MSNIYQDIADRTDSNIYIGVVGPVRTGKSTFIKKFMESMVIPNIDDLFIAERTKDELPQSGSGKTIMTAEPKFVPEEAISITLADCTQLSVRLIDSVGYMIPGATGRFENGEERMVSTPWFDHEVTMTEAAETGTKKVITDHSTIGLVITTDGSVCGIPREDYVDAEKQVIRELKAIGKPFIVLLNTTSPESETVTALRQSLEQEYDVSVLCLNCQTLTRQGIEEILSHILKEFPISKLCFRLPLWFHTLPKDNPLQSAVYHKLKEIFQNIVLIKDVPQALISLEEESYIQQINIKKFCLGSGDVYLDIELPRALYFESIQEQTGFTVANDGDILKLLMQYRKIKGDYDHISQALEDTRQTGYGIVYPTNEDLILQEPEIVKTGGKYSVKLKANAPAIHMIMTNVETAVSPAIGGETASQEIINFLLQGFDGDPARIWESNIFGKSLYDIAGESVHTKLNSMTNRTQSKFQETLQRVINEGAGGLICILL